MSYGDENYASPLQFLKETAVSSSFFDEVKIFCQDDIDQGFKTHFGDGFFSKPGGGFWVWKPYFIKKMMGEIEEGDVLVYCDAGCMINRLGKDRFEQYLLLLEHTKTGTVNFELPHLEFEYTKQEVFDFFNSTKLAKLTRQLQATTLLFKNCEPARIMVNEWLEVAKNQTDLFTDEEHLVQRKAFVAHRHDQSVFSVIRKKFGVTTLPDETYFQDFTRYGHTYPIWATRLKF